MTGRRIRHGFNRRGDPSGEKTCRTGFFRICLSLFILFTAPAYSAESVPSEITIAIDGTVEVDSPAISLGDIADISGGNPDEVERIRNISIGAAPLPGKTRMLDERYIRSRLKQNYVDMDQIVLMVSTPIEVIRKHVEVFRNEIEEKVMTFLEPRLPWDKERMSISLSGCPDSVILSDSQYATRISLPNRTGLLGAVPLQVQFVVDGQAEKKIWVTAKIAVKTDVVVVQKPLHRKQIIQDDHIDIIEMDMADLPSNHISSPDEVIGKRTLRTINPKEILRTDLVEMPPLIKRNDMVTIIAESGSLRITARGEAKESGRRGERIKVVNLDSSKELFARIMDVKTVRVEF